MGRYAPFNTDGSNRPRMRRAYMIRQTRRAVREWVDAPGRHIDNRPGALEYIFILVLHIPPRGTSDHRRMGNYVVMLPRCIPQGCSIRGTGKGVFIHNALCVFYFHNCVFEINSGTRRPALPFVHYCLKSPFCVFANFYYSP